VGQFVDIRILQAAATIFSEQGYARATTRAIATAAGVNEVTLFRHFGKKENLLAAVIDRYADLPGLIGQMQAQLTGEYRQDLLTFGHLFVQMLLARREAVRLMLCEVDHFPELGELLAQNPRRLRQMLSGYLQNQIAQGRVRPLPPETMAQAFWGMFFAHGVSLAILNEPVSLAMPLDEVVARFVDIFADGTVARDG